jgi:hypothetical protein
MDSEGPLYPQAVRVLRRIEGGRQKFHDDMFDVAYLVAREYVTADMDKLTLSLTDKGKGILEYYKEKL